MGLEPWLVASILAASCTTVGRPGSRLEEGRWRLPRLFFLPGQWRCVELAERLRAALDKTASTM